MEKISLIWSSETPTLPKLVAEAQIGVSAKVVVWRDEQEKTLYVNLGKQPSLEELASIENEGSSIFIKELGIKIRNLSEDDKNRLQLSSAVSGVILTEVDSDSFLMRQSIEATLVARFLIWMVK